MVSFVKDKINARSFISFLNAVSAFVLSVISWARFALVVPIAVVLSVIRLPSAKSSAILVFVSAVKAVIVARLLMSFCNILSAFVLSVISCATFALVVPRAFVLSVILTPSAKSSAVLVFVSAVKAVIVARLLMSFCNILSAFVLSVISWATFELVVPIAFVLSVILTPSAKSSAILVFVSAVKAVVVARLLMSFCNILSEFVLSVISCATFALVVPIAFVLSVILTPRLVSPSILAVISADKAPAVAASLI